MRGFGDECHAFVLRYVQICAIGALEVLGGEDLVGRASAMILPFMQTTPGQVRRHRVDLVRVMTMVTSWWLSRRRRLHDLVSSLDVDSHGGFIE